MRRDQKALRIRLIRLSGKLENLPIGAPPSHQKLVAEAVDTMVEVYDEILRLNRALGEQTRQVKKGLNRVHHITQVRNNERDTYRRKLAEHKLAVQQLEAMIIQLGHGDLL